MRDDISIESSSSVEDKAVAGTFQQTARAATVGAPSGTDYSKFTTESLGRCTDQLHGICNAALAELFSVVCELERRNDFLADGAKDAAGWLQVRLGLPYSTAAQWAEVALGLEGLPCLRKAFASGLLSLEKVAAAIPLATPETDEQVTREARTMSLAALKLAVRRRKEVDGDEEARAHRKRRVWWTWRDGGTRLHLQADLTAEQGARLTAALERTAARLPSVDPDGRATMAQRRADALSALASVQIAADNDPDRATFVVHVDLETLRAGVGNGGWTEEGAVLSVETVSKLLCDARLKALVEDADGKPLGVGRTMRTAPGWMRQAARSRDLTCCFPGCERTDFLVPHHLKEWSKGGPTDLDNLPLGCPTHHPLSTGKTGRSKAVLREVSFSSVPRARSEMGLRLSTTT